MQNGRELRLLSADTTANDSGPLDSASRARDHTINRSVGHRIRQQRLARGLSQEALAAAVGVHLQQVQRWEHGENRVVASRLYALSRALGVSVDFFFDAPAPAPEGPLADGDGGAPRDGEVLRVARLFHAVGDDAQRRGLLNLVRALADSDTVGRADSDDPGWSGSG